MSTMPEATPVQGWKMVSLGQIAQLRQETLQPEDASHLPYVGLEHIDPGDTVLRRFGRAEEVTSTKNRFYPGDVLYGKLRPYLDKAALAQNPGMCSTDILVVRATEHARADFLVLLLHTQALRDHAMANTNGVNHPRTSWQALSGFSFRLPPLPEQRAIARILRAVQSAREARQREVALERERKAALMAHLFTRGTRGESTKQTPIGEMPESWGLKTIGDLCNEGNGTVHTGPFGSQLHSYDYVEDGIPTVMPQDIVDQRISTKNIARVSEEDHTRLSRYHLRPGDIVYARRGDIGRRALVETEHAGWLCGTGSLLVRVGAAPVLPRYLYYYLGREEVNAFIRAQAVGTTMLNLNTSIILSVPVACPSMEEQRMLADALHACDTKIVVLERESLLLDELFRALLEELMTGRVSVAGMSEQHG